ncbi:MAG: DPP IV N-terminal domain-containing protein [Melioribacteraceae bacterium]|jgi:dipeptidyl-peptidase-4|nr:DPP IV N-terminal domain-containing protein [Melioribacteraceae bacterium]
MKHLARFLIIILLFNPLLLAQNKIFTMEDVVINSNSSLAPTTLKQLQWLPNEYSYSYIEKDENVEMLVKGFATSGKKAQLVSLETLANELEDYSVKTPKRFPKISWIDDFTFKFQAEDKVFSYAVEDEDLELIASLPENSENTTFSNDNKKIAFTNNNNLYLVVNPEGNKQITTDGKYGVTNGMSVSRNEFGISGGIFWSPKNNYLAFYHEDLTHVTDYPLVDISVTPAKMENIKYPMAGGTSPVVSLGIYNIHKMDLIWLKTDGDKDQYLTSITWGPDEKYIYVGHLNRDQNHLRLVQYDANSGEKVKDLFEEKDEQYVEPQHQLQFLENEKNKFVWFSQRDGWMHLYLYNTNGEMLKQLTKGSWVVTDFLGFDSKRDNFFVVGTKDSPMERHLYKIDFKDEKHFEKFTVNEGTHKIKKHNSMRFFIDEFSSISTPREISILTEKGKVGGIIHKSVNPIDEYSVGEQKLFSIKADDDSTDLFCRIIYPPNFDEKKKYPVIVYVYGGPHAQLVTNSWGYGRYAFWFNYMAQQGYIIFTLDNRGSANRGLEFEQAVHRTLGTKEIQDQMTGLEYLYALPYVHPARIGVFGWSYGGFMTTSLMTRTNDAFKVGVAGGAVIDWKYYEVMYTERYMDTPQQNPEGYNNASLLNHVQNLNGKLLEVHGTVDPVVLWQNTLQLTKKAAGLNIPLDYYPYPGHPHHVSGKDALHLYNKITNYFLDNL